MKDFVLAHPLFLIIGLILFFSLKGISQRVEYKTVYQGRNMYIQNPLISEKENKFCVREVYLNGLKVMDSIKSTAFEINLSNLKFNDSACVVLTHVHGCRPKRLIMGPIRPTINFYFEKVEIENDSINISSAGEGLFKGKYYMVDSTGEFVDPGNNYYIEWLTPSGWQVKDSFKGNGFLKNDYRIKIKNVGSDSHVFRIKWVANDGQTFYSSTQDYSRKK